MDCVRLISASASSLLFVASILFREVRKDERVPLLRSLALSAWRMRFFEDANMGKRFTSLESFPKFRIQNLTIYRYLHNPFFIEKRESTNQRIDESRSTTQSRG